MLPSSASLDGASEYKRSVAILWRGGQRLGRNTQQTLFPTGWIPIAIITKKNADCKRIEILVGFVPLSISMKGKESWSQWF